MPRTELSHDPRPLLDTTTAADSICVLGLGLGDRASEIPTELVVDGHCPSVPCTTRWSSDGTRTYTIQREGEPAPRPYPPQERFADACEHDGSVEIELPSSDGRVSFDIERGSITTIRLKGSWLKPLGFEARTAIQTVLGPNDLYWRSYRKTTWAWPKRGLAVVWDDKEDRLHALALGAKTCASVKCFSAPDLVRLALAWRRKHPDDDWPLRPNPELASESVEAARLKALLSAFEVTPSLAAFFDGRFLGGKPPEHAVAVLDFLSRPANDRQYLDQDDRARCIPRDLEFFWRRLLRFRSYLEEAVQFNSDVLLASGIRRLAVDLASETIKVIAPSAAERDELLGAVLDPGQKALPWGSLVRDHSFPDDDLDALICEEAY